MPPLRIAVAQINATVGDLVGNAKKIYEFTLKARAENADLVLFPELALTGYPPEDLLFSDTFIRETQKVLAAIAKNLPPGPAVVIGAPVAEKGRLYNAAAVVQNKKISALYKKHLLPNYGVFDEQRYFVPGAKPVVVKIKQTRVGLTICEDIWEPKGPALAAARAGADIIVNISASPYHAGKWNERHAAARKKAREIKRPLVYCNLVGGQDELVFDGGSFAVDKSGRLTHRAVQFLESLFVFDLGARREELAPLCAPPEEIYGALTMGLRDYLIKNRFQKAVVGLSGGIDSALVACLAVDAVGKENVVGVTLPTKFNLSETQSDAEKIAASLGIAFHKIPIEPVRLAFLETLRPLFKDKPEDLTEENLQSRIRGTMLMALSNKFGWLVLTTGNKSETSVGYSTLYGDTAGGFSAIKDISKKQVYELARWRNQKAGQELIPDSVFKRPPTAELRPNQTDQDSLPPYDTVDKIVSLYVEGARGLEDIVKAGVDRATALRTLNMIDKSEYKRRQAPPGVKITPRAFGRDRRMPLTNRYQHKS
jgi:NAD+ synthase (glutamine-hydrolysing)